MKKKAIGAILLTSLVALQLPMTAMADTQVHKHNGTNVTDHETLSENINGGVKVSNDVCKTTGDIISTSSSCGVEASDNAVVEAGDVKSVTTGIVARSGATVKVESVQSTGSNPNNCGVDASNDGTEVYVAQEAYSAAGNGILAWYGGYVEAGSAKGKGTGVKVMHGSTVVVKGVAECTGTGSDSAGIYANDGATVTAGSVKAAKNGIVVSGDNTIVVVTGDVYAVDRGVKITDGAPTVVVEGTVTTEGDTPAEVDVIEHVANFFVYELKRTDEQELGSGYNLANYIIKKTGATDGIQLQGAKTTDAILGKTYDYANGGDVITVSVKEGYDISAPLATKNADGTYTIIVPNGGGVSIEAIMKAVEKAEAEAKASFTGTVENPITNGQWNMGPGGYWTFRTDGIFKDTWGFIKNPYAKEGQPDTGWFYFDKNGIMVTGWNEIGGKWYYFNEVHDGTYGMLFTNTTTPDGKRVGADGACID